MCQTHGLIGNTLTPISLYCLLLPLLPIYLNFTIISSMLIFCIIVSPMYIFLSLLVKALCVILYNNDIIFYLFCIILITYNSIIAMYPQWYGQWYFAYEKVKIYSSLLMLKVTWVVSTFFPLKITLWVFLHMPPSNCMSTSWVYEHRVLNFCIGRRVHLQC